MRYAVVKDNVVVNVIEWDGVSPYDVVKVYGEGHSLVQTDTANSGHVYSGGEFSPPEL